MTTNDVAPGAAPLAGIRVLDVAHQYSGAFAASLLRDLGAEVIAVEHPSGSPIRTMLPKRGRDSLWWLNIQREKRNVTLKLSTPEGRELFIELAKQSDVIIENFRPGTLERWGIGPDELTAEGVNAVMLRISGFGQTGPWKGRPGFGTVAEALSGFAHLNGFPDTPPALPSVTLADGVAGIFGAFGALAGVIGAMRNGLEGITVVDTALVETLFKIIPNQVTAYEQLGITMRRYGNSLLDKGVLRDLFSTKDGRYVAIGGGIGIPTISRTLDAVDAPELAARVRAGVLSEEQPVVAAFLHEAHASVLDWVTQRTFDEVSEVFERAGLVYAPIFTVEDIVNEPHFREREDIISIAAEDGGRMDVAGIVPKLSTNTVVTERAGASIGAYNQEVFGELLGLDAADLERLSANGVI